MCCKCFDTQSVYSYREITITVLHIISTKLFMLFTTSCYFILITIQRSKEQSYLA